MSKFKEFAILIRPYGILYLGLTPVYGAICNGMFSFFHLFELFLIGILAHIFTFVQNDIFDIEIDKKSVYVSNRPLSTGTISKKMAWFIVIFSFVLSIIITVIFLFTLLSFLFLIISFVFVTLYNKLCKQLFGMEYILALGVFTYGLFGAFTVADTISFLSVMICFFAFMQWLFSVGVFANYKDVEYDIKSGIKTTPTILGVKTDRNKLIVPSIFKFYAYGIKIFHIFISALPFLLGYTLIYVNNLPVPLILWIIVSAIILILIHKILATEISQRDEMLMYEGLQEGLSFLLIPIVLMSYLFENIGPFNTLLLVVFMIAWPLSCFRLLFGKKLIPLE